MKPTVNSTRYRVDEQGQYSFLVRIDTNQTVGSIAYIPRNGMPEYWWIVKDEERTTLKNAGVTDTPQAAMDALVKAYEQTLEAQS